ncbi:unnamed protein product, partial [Sphagnum jensenii]
CRNWVPCRTAGGEEEGHDQEKEALSSKEGSAKETVESTATEVTESTTQSSNIAGLNKLLGIMTRLIYWMPQNPILSLHMLHTMCFSGPLPSQGAAVSTEAWTGF